MYTVAIIHNDYVLDVIEIEEYDDIEEVEQTAIDQFRNNLTARIIGKGEDDDLIDDL